MAKALKFHEILMAKKLTIFKDYSTALSDNINTFENISMPC